jgi:hypothetical protein
MKELKESISEAIKVMNANKLPFATIWKTGNAYGFNFDKKPLGFSHIENGVTREVIYIVKP